MDKCERCGLEGNEDDFIIEEDTHDLLCRECYYQDHNGITGIDESEKTS